MYHMHSFIIFSLNLMIFPFYLICRLISDRNGEREKKKKGKRPESQGQQHIHTNELESWTKSESERENQKRERKKLEFVPEIKKSQSVHDCLSRCLDVFGFLLQFRTEVYLISATVKTEKIKFHKTEC